MTLMGYDLMAWLRRQKDFSEKTFGYGDRSSSISAHICKELEEVKENNNIEEWIDIVIMALDQCWRISGGDIDRVVKALHEKQQVNIKRKWQDWKTIAPGLPVEHIRDGEGR
jgi:hypothetical protein